MNTAPSRGRAESPEAPCAEVRRLTPFRPAWWLPGPHLQTLGGRLLRGRDPAPLHAERIELPDGDFVDLEELRIPTSAAAPIVLLLHGLEGSARANYIVSVSRELTRVGLRAVRMNFRACSGEMNRLPRMYHAGDTEDIDFVVRHLRARHPKRPIGMIGFSLGGNMLLNYLAERGEQAREDVSAAAVVSVPFDLVSGTRRMEAGGMSRLYTEYFLRKFRRKLRAKRAQLLDHCDVDAAIAARSLREFDELVTARLHGFQGAWEYYERSSSAEALAEVRVPTLVLHALDDPFLPTEAIPADTIRDNPWLVDGVLPTGGHVGFVEGTPWRPEFWAEREAARFMKREVFPPLNPES